MLEFVLCDFRIVTLKGHPEAPVYKLYLIDTTHHEVILVDPYSIPKDPMTTSIGTTISFSYIASQILLQRQESSQNIFSEFPLL